MNNKISNATIVIRTVGERTTDLCYRLVEDQIPSSNIFVINVVPFSKAVKRTFEIGINNQLPWTIAIDADTLIRKNAIKRLIAAAETYPKPFFKGNGLAVVKFFGGRKLSNPHVYTTKYLQHGLDLFPEGEFLRPETEVCKIVNSHLQLQQAFFPILVGIHDYEQYYGDIFRKSYLFGRKHTDAINYFIRTWSHYLRRDKDYLVALAGLFGGLYSDNPLVVDANKIPSQYQDVYFLQDLKEKAKLEIEQSGNLVNKVLGYNNLNIVDSNLKGLILRVMKFFKHPISRG